eukprot:3739678-Alexandrium_andersonii.AAC.1
MQRRAGRAWAHGCDICRTRTSGRCFGARSSSLPPGVHGLGPTAAGQRQRRRCARNRPGHLWQLDPAPQPP